MGWGFAESIIFAAIMTMRDMSKEAEKSKKWIKTQNFYQECYEKIADDSHNAFNTVMRVAKKASPCYIPTELGTGSTYLPLFCFAQVLKQQPRISHEQQKVLNIYFDNMTYPFSQTSYINAVLKGNSIGDFYDVIDISDSHAGKYWINFFRALYKSGTQQDFQEVVDYTTSMIMRFAILGNPNSDISLEISKKFVSNANYHINKARNIGLTEIDWLGIVPISDRLCEMRKFYTTLIDSTDITEEISREELLPLIDELILRCICDIVMMTKHPNSTKLEMLTSAVQFAELTPFIQPEQYVKEIANNSEIGQFSDLMFSCGESASTFWKVLLIMGSKANKTSEALAVANDVLSILLQVENYLAEKYRFLGDESISRKYMLHIMSTLAKECEN